MATASTNGCILTCLIAFLALAQLAGAANDEATAAAAPRVKRMYALCPPHFVRIGQQCYFLSTAKMNWLDAHFDCKERNSQLAEPQRLEDRILRKYLQRNDTQRSVKWIGGQYNWQTHHWQWGHSGRDMDYQSFSQMVPGSSLDLKFYCAVLNAALKYRWSAKPCVQTHHFVCQHNMPFVSGKDRHKVYARWNASYPNEMANEMEVIVDDRKPGDRRRSYRPTNHAKNAATAVTQTQVPTVLKPSPRIIKNTLIDGNGRFADRKISQSVNFGAPTNGRVWPYHKRRPVDATQSASNSSAAPQPASAADGRIELDNRLDSGTDRRHNDDRLGAEKPKRPLNAKNREEHRRRKLAIQQRNEERKVRNEERRQKKHERLMREQEQNARNELTTVTPLTDDQRREEQRLAETRRMLGIDGPPPQYHQNDRNNADRALADTTVGSPTTARQPTTSTSTTTTTTTTSEPDTNTMRYDYDAERRDLEERRIRAEDERQRQEFERREKEYEQQQAEFKRQQRLAADQRENEALLAQRDRDERARQEQEVHIQAEIRERKERERLQEEKRQRDLQVRHEREKEHQRAEEQRRQTKLAKESEIRRLKEMALRNHDPGTNEVVNSVEEELAERERQRVADAVVQKKLKRDKIMKKLKMMTPEQQMEFLAKRAERNKKRQVGAESNANNEAAIPK